jgi:hypothetical protein
MALRMNGQPEFLLYFSYKNFKINNFYIYGRLLLAALNWRSVAISNRRATPW